MPTLPKIRCFITYATRRRLVFPRTGDSIEVERTLDESNFFYRDKPPASLTFAGDDFAFLWKLENSSDRCAQLLLELESYNTAQGLYRPACKAVFTLSECTFRPALCEVEVGLTPEDGYRDLFENWDEEVNLLASPAARVRAVTQLNLDEDADVRFEFKRIGQDQEGDFVGDSGWAEFLRNNSWITGSGLNKGTRDRSMIIFRLVREDVPYVQQTGTANWLPQDLSDEGFFLIDQDDATRLATYAKEPALPGFRPFLIGTYGDWIGSLIAQPGRPPSIGPSKYGDKLLLLNCGQQPPASIRDKYIKVTGVDGAQNDETSPCLNVRRQTNENNAKSLWWRFGYFEFKRSIRLLDAIHFLLQQCAPQLAPPRPEQLSDFFSNPTNYVTGTTLPDNELPGLLVAAASDIKRNTASEAATRLLVSLKVLVEDVNKIYKTGHFIDPQTGWFRMEHQAWIEARPRVVGATLDLTQPEFAARVRNATSYSYLKEKLPRKQTLAFSNAQTTAATPTDDDYTKATILYEGKCVNRREGESETTLSVTRITTDLPGLLVQGELFSDNAVVLLAARPDGTILNGNAVCSATQVVRAYHTYGGVRTTGTLQGQPLMLRTLRPARQQEPVTVCRPQGLEEIVPGLEVKTAVSPKGLVRSAKWNLTNDLVTFTLQHPPVSESGAPPSGFGRQWDDSFSPQFA